MCVISYLRIWTSVYLQTHADDFLPYLAAFASTHQSNQIYTDMKTFCSSEVEPMDRDVDHIQIIALTSAMTLPVRIEYFDQSETTGNSTTFYDMPNSDNAPKTYLLYRPGHYDIIKPTQK
jgi:ubiquitin thioesterase protein OTUB1